MGNKASKKKSPTDEKNNIKAEDWMKTLDRVQLDNQRNEMVLRDESSGNMYDSRKKITTNDTVQETSKIGELLMLFDHPKKKNGENFSGTAMLYVKLSSDYYIIITAAHNFLMFSEQGKGQNKKYIEKKFAQAYFFL